VATKRPRRSGKASQPSRAGGARQLKSLVVPLDAEDIAMARLQAHLRKAEAIRAPIRSGGTPLSRTTLRLPREMLQQVRDQARREGTSVSEVVEVALERYLRSP
jgi:3-dehydroquinate synthase class II